MMAAKVGGLEAGPPDQEPVDVGLARESAAFSALHRAPVLDADGLARLGPASSATTVPDVARRPTAASSAVAARPVPMAQMGS